VAVSLPDDVGATYPNVSEFRVLAISFLTYVIGWFAVPIVFLELGRWLKRYEEMPSYITVYNWFQLIHLPFSISRWAMLAGGFDAIGQTIGLLSIAVYFVYVFYLSRSFLRLENHLAALFVVADLAISIGLIVAGDLALAS